MSVSMVNHQQSLRMNNGLKSNALQINRSMEQIATGSKLSSAKNNPSAYAINISMAAQIMAQNQSVQNTQNSNALLKTAAGAAHSTVGALSSLKEKLIGAANGTNNASDRSILQEEVNQLVSTLDDNASVTFNGKNLIDGSLSGANALQVATGEGMQNISIDSMTSESLGLTAGGKPTIDISTNEGIAKALDLIDGYTDENGIYREGALEKAITQEAKIGAAQQGLNFKENNLVVSAENTTASSSVIGDTNMAKAAMELQQNLLLKSAKLMMLSQSNHSNYGVLALMK